MVTYPRAIYNYRKNLKLNELQKDIIVGSLLGGSTMDYRKTNFMYNIKFEQNFKNRFYIRHLYDIFEGWCYRGPHLYFEIDRERYRRTSYWFQTFKHFAFFRYWNGFYESYEKVVPLSINRWVSSRALAYWFMDSGEKYQNTYVFHLHHFSTPKDHKMLLDLLKHMFWLDAEICIDPNRGWYKLRLLDGSVPKFISIVEPYIIPCMRYKL